jgi:predicted DNA-binding antitoxin AbrB/MazE fold protein
MINFLHSIRQWLELALVIAVAGFLFIHFVLKPPQTVTLPGGQVINMDTKSFENGVKKILRKVDEQSKKINDLESTIRQIQTQTVTHDIPEAMAEKDIRKSIERMKAAW